MLPFGKDKSVKEWRSWIKERNRLKGEILDLEIRGRDAKGLASKLACLTRMESHKGLELLDVKVHQFAESELPTPDDVAPMLQAAISSAEKGRHVPGKTFNINVGEARKTLNDLRYSLEDRDKAQRSSGDLADRLELVRERLEELENAPPKAGHGALKALDEELKSSRDEASRVTAAMEARHDTGGAVATAKEEAARAQERVDDLEAAAALGEVGDGERQAASAALTKARNKLTDAKDAADRQAAAARGLHRQLDKVNARIKELEDLRAEVAREVHMDDIAAAEIELVDMLGSDRVRELVETINASRSALNQAINYLNGSERKSGPHSSLKLTIEASHLIAHPEWKEFNRSGIKV